MKKNNENKTELDNLIFDFFKENIDDQATLANASTVNETNVVVEKKVSTIATTSDTSIEEPSIISETNSIQPYLKTPPKSPVAIPNSNIQLQMPTKELERFREEQKERMVRRSEEVDEILSYIPHWMIRWGITVLFLIILSILAMSYFIKYPDVVKGSITLTTNSPPAEVVSRNAGSLLLYEKDKTVIDKGDVIALLRNNADYEDVLSLKYDLALFKESLATGVILAIKENYSVGELQNTYGALIMSIKSHFLAKKSSTNDVQRKRNLDTQIRQLELIGRKQKQSVDNLEKEYNIIKAAIRQRYLPLYKKGSISKEQLEAKESEVRSQFNNLQSAKVGLTENQNRILDIRARQSELDYSGSDKLLNSQNEISNAYNNLVNQIEKWEQQYLLRSPIDGTLNYLQFVKDNMHVRPDQLLASIIPEENNLSSDEQVIIGELFINAEGSGKVEVGQVVNVELSDFSKKEFGILKGEVLSVSDITTDFSSEKGKMAAYKVDVSFPEGMITSIKKDIRFRYNMKGQAEVITEDIRLLERIFSELRAVFRND